MHAFEQAIHATASKYAPWFVVPANNKWFTRLVVAAAIVETVEEHDLTYPKDRCRKGEGADGGTHGTRPREAAAVAVTMSAHYAGAVGLDQACATSSRAVVEPRRSYVLITLPLRQP
jgi:hypothetical protein